ncbi:tetratricopeptide repeat protein [Tumebacillus sp. ITR2]|uniref:Tetratricopeptide repeat protein n=1 Tax=Tumebacillus amylolyticus TaxID=2801339 RepID=A0ABS1JD77_9BACL|nr:tetratricopeptide repeat protein [Tumebacillus amylolyticus]MBL0388226.1 tetratricopeptide repeat protein [Tumebacillus amylolyticus]
MTLGVGIREVRVGKGVTQMKSTEGRATNVLSAIADQLEVTLDNLTVETDRRAEALSLYQEALERKRSMDYAGALDRLEELLKQPFFGVEAVDLMCHLAECYLRVGDLPESFHWYHFALEEACVEQNQKAMIEIYRGLGNLEFSQARYEYALRHYDRALAISERLPNQDGAMTTHLYVLLGTCQKRMRRVKEAMQCFRLAVSCCEGTVNRRSVVWLLLMISPFFREMSFEWEANAYTERAATILREEGVLDLAAELPNHYTVLLGIKGDLSEVCTVLQDSLSLLDESGYDVEAGIGYVELAKIAMEVDPNQAEAACRMALQRFPEEPEHRTSVFALLGEISCRQEAYEEASHHFQKAADGYKQLKQAKQWAGVMQTLSWIYRKLEGARIS